MWGFMKNVGAFNLSDYFPVLQMIDPQGIMRDSKFYFQKLFEIFDDIIDERVQVRGSSKTKKNDLLETLLDHSIRNVFEFGRNDLKHLLLVSVNLITFNKLVGYKHTCLKPLSMYN